MSNEKTTPARRARASAGASTPDLAKLIQQVMTHPDVPEELYNGLSEGLSEITWRGNGKAHDLIHIRSCLATIGAGVKSTAADHPPTKQLTKRMTGSITSRRA
jgi:hypothetical protein